MKRRLLAIIVLVTGCAATTSKDALLVLERGSVAMVTAIQRNDYESYYRAISDMKTGYHEVMGPQTPLFDAWMDLYIEMGKTAEAGEAAEKRGEDTTRYSERIKVLRERIHDIGPVVGNQIQQAQLAADQRADRRAEIAALITGLFVGVVASAATAPRTPPPTPAIQPPVTTHCYQSGNNVYCKSY